MGKNILEEIFLQAAFGYACHEPLFDDKAQPEDFTFLDINPVYEEITGLKRADIIGKRVLDVMNNIPGQYFDLLELYKSAVLTGNKQELVQYAEGLKRWYKITAILTEKKHLAVMFQDITSEMDQIVSYEKLLSHYEIMINSSQDAMFLVRIEDNGVRYVMNNKSYQKFTGYSAEEMKDKTAEEILGKEMSQYFYNNYVKAFEAKLPVELEENFVLHGKERTWHTVITPIIEDGAVKYILGSRKDITLQKKAETEKESLFQRQRAMFSEHTAVMLLIDPISGKIVDANPAASSYYGYTMEELIKMHIHEINILPRQEIDKMLRIAVKEKQKYYLFPHRKKNGEIRLVDIYSCPVTHNGEKLLYSIIFDVTDRESYKTELYKEKEFLRTTLYSIGDGVVTTDKEGKIIALNRAAEEITGWSIKEAAGRPFSEVFKLVGESTGQGVEDPVAKVLNTGMVVGLANHTVLLNKAGFPIPISDSAAPIKDETGKTFGVVMVFHDVTLEKEQQEQILYLSQHDHLTGLLNRRSLEEEVKRLDNDGHLPLAVIMGDVNGLKLTNDVFGHEEGDLILQRTARSIRDNCRKGDIVIRWGGDEFLILLPRTTAAKAEKVIRRIKKSCALKSENTLQLSISLGYSIKTTVEEDLHFVIREAEEIMYRKKLTEGKAHRNVIIRTLLKTLYEKGLETKEHSQRMKACCTAIGKKLKCSGKDLKDLNRLALLYDIGRTGILESVLKKPGSLSPEEWQEVKKHPEIGFRIAQNAHEISNLAEYILYHHERWDGKGYPQGLAGEEIPLLSRIIAVADAYNAMIEDRPYRKAMSNEEAIDQLKRNSGTQFEQEAVAALVKYLT